MLACLAGWLLLRCCGWRLQHGAVSAPPKQASQSWLRPGTAVSNAAASPINGPLIPYFIHNSINHLIVIHRPIQHSSSSGCAPSPCASSLGRKPGHPYTLSCLLKSLTSLWKPFYIVVFTSNRFGRPQSHSTPFIVRPEPAQHAGRS